MQFSRSAQARELAHMRKVKSEKLMEILRQQQYDATASSMSSMLMATPQMKPHHHQRRLHNTYAPAQNNRFSSQLS